MPVSRARERLSGVVEFDQCEAVEIEPRGRRAAVTVSPSRHDEMLDALVETHANARFDAALGEDGNSFPGGM
jgi:hypothetical protein